MRWWWWWCRVVVVVLLCTLFNFFEMARRDRGSRASKHTVASEQASKQRKRWGS